MLPNTLQYPIAMFGALRAGLVVVNTNPLYTAPELEHQLKDSGATAIVVLENFAHVLQQVIAHTNVSHVLVTAAGELLRFPKSHIVNYVVRHVRKQVPPWSHTGSALLQGGSDQGSDTAAPAGRSQLRRSRVPAVHRRYYRRRQGSDAFAWQHGANVLQAQAWIGRTFEESGRTLITAIPLYHIFALSV